MSFDPPLAAIRFALNDIIGFDRLRGSGAFDDLSSELIDAVLNEAGRLAADAIAPTNEVGDREKSQLHNGAVTTPTGFKEAYAAYRDGGWAGLSVPQSAGGQGLPRLLGIAVQELVTAGNMAFSLCPVLSKSGMEALINHGTSEQRRLYLPKLVAGTWTGTMVMTEPEAGSDVGAIKTRAVPQADGSYRLSGTKIFITWGEHDLAENIIHFVLARLPDAPVGTRGLSLFLVPKRLVNDDGGIGALNDVRAVSLEHKLGIHGSPTCVMAYGEKDGAVAYLVGEENRGMACMFTMMNDARLGIGLQGVAVAERAYQKALAYAGERRQGKPFGRQHEAIGMQPIIEHPDIRRMLFAMKANIEAARALCYATAEAIDLAHVAPSQAERANARARADLFTPLAKSFSTDIGVEVASLGIQIHGGMGYIEETGAAQHFRDARIAPIYEGTNGIQAIDLVTRKLPMAGGAVVSAFLDEVESLEASLARAKATSCHLLGGRLGAARAALAEASDWLQTRLKTAPVDALAGATPYQRLFSIVAGGYFLGRGALAADRATAQAEKPGNDGPIGFYAMRLAVAQFFAADTLPLAPGLAAAAMAGADHLMAPPATALSD